MKKYHFISGLPRSGSTLLTSILNQNPRFHSRISNPLARFVKSVVTETYAGPGYALECTEKMRSALIKNLIETYHADYPGEVNFNTNRGWSLLLPMLDTTFPDAKLICCVRDIPWVLDSFEKLFRNNPFTISRLYSESERETVYTRADALMSPGHSLRFPYDCLKEAVTGPQKRKIMLVDYDQLVSKPEVVMKALYNFIGEPYFEHDFNNVEASYDEYDAEAGIYGLHKIRNKVEYLKRETILPPDLWKQYSGLEFWK
jgi:sulfotransferase